MAAKRKTAQRRARTTLTHVDARGAARMVDVSAKRATEREARAEAWLLLSPEAAGALDAATNKKGDPIATARIAGIMAAKRTHELIPLCHPLKLSSVRVEIGTDIPVPSEIHTGSRKDLRAVRIESLVMATDRTGVEMEALTAASVTALTLYDMLKAVDKGMILARCRLLEKRGGASGDFVVED